jgi:hypothetical protein
MFLKSDYGVPILEARKVHRLTTCARDVVAALSETDEAVSIDEIDGDSLGNGLDGPDCQGGVTLSLRQPVGDRAVVVEGTSWRLQQGAAGVLTGASLPSTRT